MATDDRKRRILEHLSRSSSGTNYTSKKPIAPAEISAPSPEPAPLPAPVSSTPPAPSVKPKDKKRQIMEHLSLSSQEFEDIPKKSEDARRKRQIQEHIRRSL